MKKLFTVMFCLVAMSAFAEGYYMQTKACANKTFNEIKEKNFKVKEVKDMGDAYILITYG